jgi:uncharacterized membrane protein YfcA
VSALPALVWAALLAMLAAVLALWTGDAVTMALLPAAIAIVLLVALASRRAADPRERVVPDATASAPLAACGLAGLAVGAVAGLWAALVGAGLLVVAIIAAVRERSG